MIAKINQGYTNDNFLTTREDNIQQFFIFLEELKV